MKIHNDIWRQTTGALFDIGIPIYKRTSNIQRVFESILASIPDPAIVNVFFISGEETNKRLLSEAYQAIRAWAPGGNDRNDLHVDAKRGVESYAKRHNDVFNLFGAAPWYVAAADDVVFHRGWAAEAAHAFLTTGCGVLGTNDLGNDSTIVGTFSTHPIISRFFVESHPSSDAEPIFHEGYRHNCCDLELAARAKKISAWKAQNTVVIEHHHPAWGKAPRDETYGIGDTSHDADWALWTARSAENGWSL